MSNPNAIVGVLAAGPGAQAVLEVSSQFHWKIDAGLAIYISAAIAGTALFIGRAGAYAIAHGLRGCRDAIMDGIGTKPNEPPETPPANDH